MEEEMTEVTDHTMKRWIWIAVFAIAFAWVESAVVVYLRAIYYGGGFSFPIVTDWQDGKYVIDNIMRIELGREAATIIMLAAAGCLAGRNFWQKFSFFMIAFGIWDISFYVWLRVMVSWPESLLTWDILFLIPLPWVGSVITPILIALAMTIAGSFIIYFDEKGYSICFRWFDWVVILGCGLLMIVAFCWDWKNIIRLPGDIEYSGLPNPFLWELYLPAYLFSIIYFALRLAKVLRSKDSHNQ